MSTLCVILARAGSRGLPGKNTRLVAGKPMIAWTIDHARGARYRGAVDRIVVSTDGEQIGAVARSCGAEVIMRPPDLASDTATVDAAARHAVEQLETAGAAYDRVVILYGNVPVRPDDLIDRAAAKLAETGCDSVQSVAAAGKTHPYWMKRVEGDRLLPYVENNVYRRQDLPPVYMLDGGIIAVTRASLFTVRDGEPHAFLGADRRVIVTEPGAVVDVDDEADAIVAEAALRDRSRLDELLIGGRPIGPRHDCYVIAELGVNHDGSVERALELTRCAAACGADAVKLQLFDPALLLSAEAELAAYQHATADDPASMLAGLQLGLEPMRQVRTLAHDLGMGFVVTPFSMDSADALRALGVDAVKIASPDCVNVPLIRAMRALGKPMLISVGAAERSELQTHAAAYEGAVLMQCVSSYPVPPGASGFAAIDRLAALGSGIVGYSDHTELTPMGLIAAARGYAVLEKHLTYDRGATGPDHAASLDPAAFAEYVRLVRLADAEKAVADKVVQDIERDVRRVSRQSVCATRRLGAGHVIERADVTVKRPGTGIAAARLDEVVGRRLRRDVEANHLLHDGDVEPT